MENLEFAHEVRVYINRGTRLGNLHTQLMAFVLNSEDNSPKDLLARFLYQAARGSDNLINIAFEKRGFVILPNDPSGMIINSYSEALEKANQILQIMEKNALTFGEAINAAQFGKRIARSGWNGKNMFVFHRPGDKIFEKDRIASISTLPQTVKAFLLSQENPVEFLPYLCMYTADGKIVNGWLASQTDILATDWQILDDGEKV